MDIKTRPEKKSDYTGANSAEKKPYFMHVFYLVHIFLWEEGTYLLFPRTTTTTILLMKEKIFVFDPIVVIFRLLYS